MLFYRLLNTSASAVAENKRPNPPPTLPLAVQSCPVPCAKAHFCEESGQGIELVENYPWRFLGFEGVLEFFSLVSAASVSCTLSGQRKPSNDKNKRTTG